MKKFKYLNIGSSLVKGQYKDPQWINVDLNKARGVNVLASAFSLPFKNKSFEKVHCIHVLEHLTRDKIPLMLEEINRVCVGKAFIEVPDFKATIKLLNTAYEQNNRLEIHIRRTSIYGKTERSGMAHHFGFDYETLKEYAEQAGFQSIKRLTNHQDMISLHYKLEPIILVEIEN